ncbi:MAG TPA: tRNA (adenosine(37)-N6)-dimethylallyltransferase MiaA [Candidatus Eisenbacteria bacterium]|nr:tRNA (adenosine(37)-N6)-dimethylallyltransferase MiaA [Candidatus Eisenbacteria bacterium]
MTLPKHIAVVGPTASGKTDLALVLAKRFKGEIISADSRQFYRGTEIGSDIPEGRWERVKGEKRKRYIVRGVPHYLMSFLTPSKTFTAAQFKDHVVRISKDIIKRGHVPILAGGTGLYIRTVVDNLDIPAVPPDAAFRERAERKSTTALYAELKKKDPAYAARIPAGNRRYAIRALEVIAATGKPFSEVQGKGEPLFEALQLGIRRPRAEMYRRIDARVDAMMRRGLLEEAKRLGKRYGWKVPAMSGLGHRQLGLFLRGEATLEEAVELIKRDTRHFAKRQMTWFRRDRRIRWVKNERDAEKLARKFLRPKKGK